MDKAASFAATIQAELGLTVELEGGKRGQFDVFVDDRMVLSRKGGLIAMLTRKPWPTDADVLKAIREA